MQLFDIPLATLLIAVLATTIGATVQGSVGFGLAMISSPILLIVEPRLAPCPLMFCVTMLTIMILIREHRSVVKTEVAISSVSRLITTIPTAYVVSVVDAKTFSLLFSTAVLLVISLNFAGLKVKFNHRNLAIASGIAGISNTISAIGGPAMAIIYQSQKGTHIRGTLSAIFAVGSTMSMLSLAAVGKFGWKDIQLAMLLMPGILIGFGISHYTARALDKRNIRPAVLAVAGLSALVILVKTLLSY
ncbi:Sulfite exporter TauE/SafE [Aeoliella mucimassa]|uniref:Probable membrane transporter protein n=1 Tax=Aeoliella mucimassa TaxID=2527972 RepID=A0A518AIN3_9BACT|nr:Sulfite exporter TauE/SafE [Aeoliella mucimassa]